MKHIHNNYDSICAFRHKIILKRVKKRAMFLLVEPEEVSRVEFSFRVKPFKTALYEQREENGEV